MLEYSFVFLLVCSDCVFAAKANFEEAEGFWAYVHSGVFFGAFFGWLEGWGWLGLLFGFLVAVH